VHVEIGDHVTKGDILFTIKTPISRNRILDAKISLEKATENYSGPNNLLKNIEVEIETGIQQLKQDSINYDRVKNLWSKNIGAKQDLEKAQLKFQLSSNNVDLLKKKYKQTAQELDNAYKRSLNNLDNERTQLKDYTVFALADGKVYDLYKEVGELITPQERFAEIANIDSFKIDMDVDETDITRVSIGDTAVISLDAYPNKVFTALVNKILPKKDQQNLTYTLEGSFIDYPDKLLYGLSGEANIIVGRRKTILTIPTNYINTNDEVQTENGIQKIATGIRTLDFVEVVSGIDTSTVLVIPN